MLEELDVILFSSRLIFFFYQSQPPPHPPPKKKFPLLKVLRSYITASEILVFHIFILVMVDNNYRERDILNLSMKHLLSSHIQESNREQQHKVKAY